MSTDKKNNVNPVKILMVEDNPIDAELIQLMLHEEISNLEFDRVFSETDLRTKLDEFQPQLIISDYSMPGFSGLEALKICRTEKPQIPFIFVSGTIGEERAVEALKNGASDYVLKNSLPRLPHAIKHAIKIKQERNEKRLQQEELASTYEVLKSVFYTSHMMVTYLDPDFNFVKVNTAFAERHKQSTKYFKGKNFLELFPEIKREEVFKKAKETKEIQHVYFYEVVRDFSKKQCFDWSISPTLRDNEIIGFVYTCVDVTERMKLKTERDQLLRSLEQRVESRTRQLNEANQKLVDFNKDFIDSVNYAKRIQEAFIPKLNANEVNVEKAFLLNLPKDILSGDFYWYNHDQETNCSFVAIGDCTGHGVPGSLMTLLAIQLLEQSFSKIDKQADPALILEDINHQLINFLNPNDASPEIKDGMEIALLKLDHKEKLITYSSAGRPIFFFNDSQLELLRFERSYVGGNSSENQKSFINHTKSFEKGNRLYIFSDGYADQFGGPKNSKLLRKRLIEHLIQIQELPFTLHKNDLEFFIKKWRGEEPQVDDIIVLGLEF